MVLNAVSKSEASQVNLRMTQFDLSLESPISGYSLSSISSVRLLMLYAVLTLLYNGAARAKFRVMWTTSPSVDLNGFIY